MKKTKFFYVISILILCMTMLSGCGLGRESKPTLLLGACNLDVLKGSERDALGNYTINQAIPEIVAQGWIANDQAGESPLEVTVSISNSLGELYAFESAKTLDRPDVAAFFKKPGMTKSGFQILIESVKVPGKYTISLQGKYKSGSILCPRTFTLVVS